MQEPFVNRNDKNVVDGLLAIAGAITHLAEAHNRQADVDLEIFQAQAYMTHHPDQQETATPVAPVDPQTGVCFGVWDSVLGHTVYLPNHMVFGSNLPEDEVGERVRECNEAYNLARKGVPLAFTATGFAPETATGVAGGRCTMTFDTDTYTIEKPNGKLWHRYDVETSADVVLGNLHECQYVWDAKTATGVAEHRGDDNHITPAPLPECPCGVVGCTCDGDDCR